MQLNGSRFGAFILILLQSLHLVHAEDLLQATGLTQCSESAEVTVNNFNAVFTPANNSISIIFDGYSEVAGEVLIEVDLLVYGYKAFTKSFDPCSLDLAVFCPMKAIELQIPTITETLSDSLLSQIPSISYGVPDIDAVIRLRLIYKNGGKQITCLETRIRNGKTVYQAGVSWTLAVITGLGLVTSTVISLLGHSNTATHLAFRSLAFLGFIQTQAMAGMTSVKMPPFVQSWTQNMQWSLGIVQSDALQTIATWFQRATGGTPSNVVTSSNSVSVVLQKRSSEIVRRATDQGSQIILRGIERVGVRESIEPTNIFMTGYLFYYFITAVIVACVGLVLVVRIVLAKKPTSLPKLDRALGVTADWKTILRNTFFRLACIGYPQMCVLCLWELTRRDSAAEIVLAITMWLVTTAVLAFAAFKVFQRALRSKQQHNTPAYTLYSDPATLSQWGFLYIYYRAPVYYFLVPTLVYTIVKGMVIAFAQPSPVAQSIVLLILELCMMLATAIIKPFMSKGANVVAITAGVLNSLNTIFLLVFSDVFDQPDLMTGILGVLFFILNAIFTLVLLIYLLVGIVYAIFLKKPDTKYKPLGDDRDSFRWSRTATTTELSSLEKIARGEEDAEAHPYPPRVATAPPSDEDVSMAARRPYNDVVDPSLPLFPTSYDHLRR
ncbi:TRP-like family [Penicillium coprophilum]|uniref:TRP-like family n=1 Tax=Penicillium coprophilum TaxID=36646 RepID=UPI00239A94AE|nr:TRP-like family [Penicillium coprophilum]KAJ5163246.1 TRP-like family [Penicillium coprophilum]